MNTPSTSATPPANPNEHDEPSVGDCFEMGSVVIAIVSVIIFISFFVISFLVSCMFHLSWTRIFIQSFLIESIPTTAFYLLYEWETAVSAWEHFKKVLGFACYFTVSVIISGFVSFYAGYYLLLKPLSVYWNNDAALEIASGAITLVWLGLICTSLLLYQGTYPGEKR